MNSKRELLRYLATGTCGFLVDAGVMQWVSEGFEVSVLVARCASFPPAATVTWLLNRYWTFEHGRARKASSQYVLYLCGQLVSLVVNFGVFAALLLSVEIFANRPIAALAVGAVVGLVFNFLFARLVAFRQVVQAPCANGDKSQE